MRTRLIIALRDVELEQKLAEMATEQDTQVECYGRLGNPWQTIVQSCGDILVVEDCFVEKPLESGIATLNNLPENPTVVIAHSGDSPEQHAQLIAAGADVVLFTGISVQNFAEALVATLESHRQNIKLERYERRGRRKPLLSDFYSKSEVMQIFMQEALQVASSDSLLLILGETGAGKEHLAKVIHGESPRASGPFVAVNAAALPEQLLESELFGHKQGAFTGATRSRRGAFEQAHGGTIFLDEIGELPLHLQAKLLRVLQDFEIRPIGAEKPIWVDVRVITATNKDLAREVAQGSFRKDLFYRLSVVTLEIPPLRERREDIPALARRALASLKHQIGRDVNQISDVAMQALCRYGWPGNVRELMNVIERSILLARSGEVTLTDLPEVFQATIGGARRNFEQFALPADGSWVEKSLKEVREETLARVERQYLEMVLHKTRGRIGDAADLAGISQKSLYNLMQRHALRKEQFKKDR
jgi:two-component system response regulator AtoC